MTNAAPSDLYMGIDLSTQQCKCLIVSSNLKLAYSALVDFDVDLAYYGTERGVLTNAVENEIYAPVAMWLEALDLVLSRLHNQGLDFDRVKGVSCAGMQHGSVFWGPNAETVMSRLDGDRDLAEQMIGKSMYGNWNAVQLKGVFAHEYSPNWQDASTQKQCDKFDGCLGGPEKLAEVTGSKAHHRFSGPQIMRYREKHPDCYLRTSRISLVSSFLSSVLLGRIAPIDIADVTGMNLWDICNGSWHERLLALCAGGASGVSPLTKRLGPIPEDGGKPFGHVSSYFVARYGFSKNCQVIPGTGDNPATILALPLREGDVMVSLGTSTTFLMSTSVYRPDPAYHFMKHPTTAGLYMFMLCYKNGGLARESVRDALDAVTARTNGCWERFDWTALSTAVLGQRNANPTDPMKLALYFPRPEIVPNVRAGTWRFLYDPTKVPSRMSSNADIQAALTSLPSGDDHRWGGPIADVRAIVESQFLSIRLRSAGVLSNRRSASLGGTRWAAQPRRVYLVGGGSQSAAMADMCGQVLGGADGVFRLDIGGNACALGAAYKAAWGVRRTVRSSTSDDIQPFQEFLGAHWDEASFVTKVADGYRPGVFERYGDAVAPFGAAERWVLGKFSER